MKAALCSTGRMISSPVIEAEEETDLTRVLMLTSNYFPHVGGIEYTSRVMARVMLQSGISCQVLCFNGDAQSGDLICRRGETVQKVIDGIPVTYCGCFAKVASQSLSLTYPRELRRMMDTFRPDIVVFHYPNPYLAEFLLHYKARDFKLIVYYHLDITRQKILGKLFHPQTMALLDRADRIIATSRNYIDGSRYLKKYTGKCVVIPSCIDMEHLRMTDKAERLARDIREQNRDKTICFAMGRHVPYKGLTHLIEASKLLDDSFLILLGGQGPLTESLRKEAAGDEKIRFLGRIDDEDVSAYYSACDIFCFPSITKNEAFGLVLLEAMYFGKPCVTFTIPGSGVNYVNLDGVTGIECPNGDSAALAAAIRKLAADPALRQGYGRAAQERVRKEFMRDKYSVRINEMIEEVSPGNTGGRKQR